ncbi:MAG TPA: energy transducer TonB, partial [Chitinophagales bacterium]|nr:energy transducer TonB [Chitinophagales bacterium]
TVAVTYEIDFKGDVIDAKIKSGIGYGCDEEAIRVVKMLKFAVPKHHKLRVTFHRTINIHFRLPKPQKQSTQYVYNYVEKKKEGKSSYTYNISFQR